MSDPSGDYPWSGRRAWPRRLALVLDVGEVLARHGYDAPAGLYRALHPEPPYRPPTMY